MVFLQLECTYAKKEKKKKLYLHYLKSHIINLALLNSISHWRYSDIGVCVKGSTSNKIEVNYYGMLWKVIELWYYSEQYIIALFRNGDRIANVIEKY